MAATRTTSKKTHIVEFYWLLGAGRPLFAHIGDKPIKLERTQVIATPTKTHLRYRIVR